MRKSANCKAQISTICIVNDTDLCVAICRFSQVVFVTSNNFIVFGINSLISLIFHSDVLHVIVSWRSSSCFNGVDKRSVCGGRDVASPYFVSFPVVVLCTLCLFLFYASHVLICSNAGHKRASIRHEGGQGPVFEQITTCL